MRSCGEALIQLLEGYGVDTVFGIPGAHTLELYRGLAASRLRHVTPRHEQGAGFMADGYARASGRPGVCFVVSGPGLSNVLTAMGQALSDSIPMLVISSVNSTRSLGMGEGRLHELPEQRALPRAVARFSHTLLHPEQLPKVIARAFALFAGERPGPVHIEIPIDVLAQPAGDDDCRPWPVPAPPAPAAEAIDEALSLLRAARRPLIAVGGGALGAGAELLRLAESLDAPVLNTVAAKGLLPCTHPLALGGSVSCAPLRAALEDADVVLAVGTELGETDFDFAFAGDLQLRGKLIRVDIDASQLVRSYRPEVAIRGDARQTLRALAAREGPLRAAGDGVRRARALREALRGERDPYFERFFATLRELAPDAVLVGDSTKLSYYAWMHHEAASPRSYFHSASGYGTLGYAIPAAIGAKLAQPARKVVCLIGDGGAQFTLAELAAAAEIRIPVVFIVSNNCEFGEIREMMEARAIAPIGIAAHPVDFRGAARSLGCEASRAASFEQLGEQLGAALAHDGPFLIELAHAELARSPELGATRA